MPHQPTVHHIFEAKTGTWQYIVVDPDTLDAAIIDPVLDFDPVGRRMTTEAADGLLSVVKEANYHVRWILETHAHADHLTAALYLQNRLAQEQGSRPPIGIGQRIEQVQKLFGRRYGIGSDEYQGAFDKFFQDDEVFRIGNLEATALHLPGHTPDHLGYHIGDNVFCGDSIFHADIGSARCDFPGGNANQLFNSGRRLLALPDHVRIWTGHDYPPEDRSTPQPFMTVEDHKKSNRHFMQGVSEAEFVKMRSKRDEELGEPRLLHQSLQLNVRAGRLPKPTEMGDVMFHLPLKSTI